MASLTDKNQTKNKSKEKQNKITRSIKRLLCDFKHYMDTKPDLTYVSICNDNAHLVKVLIFGPEGTPYHNGNFFIDLKFPNDYPYNPPKANFLTTDGRIRFNPNLYATGKVCLSILGTWSGPSWSIVQRLSSVILSIQSLLGEHPLRKCKEELVSLHKYAEEYLSKTKETLDELKETDYDGKTFKVL
jgi:ubiquitin-protein ligase